MFVCAIVGAALGALVAWMGATELVVCHDTPAITSAACGGGGEIMAVMWGAPIGLVAGLVLGLTVTHPRRGTGGLSS